MVLSWLITDLALLMDPGKGAIRLRRRHHQPDGLTGRRRFEALPGGAGTRPQRVGDLLPAGFPVRAEG